MIKAHTCDFPHMNGSHILNPLHSFLKRFLTRHSTKLIQKNLIIEEGRGSSLIEKRNRYIFSSINFSEAQLLPYRR